MSNTKDYFENIITELRKEPKTISQIANTLKINFESTKNHMLDLEKLGLVIKSCENNKEYYAINPNPTSQKEFGTYFNLPITESQKNLLETYYYLIKENWIKITQKKPTITQIYKVLAKINFNHPELKLPIGWYNYGQMPILIYKEENATSEKTELTQEQKKEILNTILEYSKIPLVRQLIKEQYKEFNKTAYIVKEEIFDELAKLTQKNSITKELSENYKKLLNSTISDKLSREILQYLNDYYGLLLSFRDVAKNSKQNEFLLYKEILINSFKELWKFIALDYYKTTLQELGLINPQIIENCLKKEIQSQKSIVEENMYELIEIIDSHLDSLPENSKLSKYFQKIQIPEKIKIDKLSEKDYQTIEEQEKMLKEMGLLD